MGEDKAVAVGFVLCCVVLCVFVVSASVFHVVSCWHKARLSLYAVFDIIPQFAKLRVCGDTKYFQNASLIKILLTLDMSGNLLGDLPNCKFVETHYSSTKAWNLFFSDS